MKAKPNSSEIISIKCMKCGAMFSQRRGHDCEKDKLNFYGGYIG